MYNSVHPVIRICVIMKPIAIIGIGNYLMGDEGIGIHAIEYLCTLEWPEDVELIDAGTPGMSLLHMIEGRKLAIIIDCADFGGAPGEIRIFDPDDLRHDDNPAVDLHAMDLLGTLELARKVGNCPEHIAIIGIQPKDISMGRELSAEARRALDAIPDEVDRLRRQNDL